MGCDKSLIPAPTKHFAAVLNNDKGTETETRNQYARYQRFSAEEFVLQSGGVLCPQPNCGTGIMPSQNDNASPDRRVVCTECRYVFCRSCLQGYHIGNCQESQATENAALGLSTGARDEFRSARNIANANWASRARWHYSDNDMDAGHHEERRDDGDNISASMSSWVAIRVTTKPCPKVSSGA